MGVKSHIDCVLCVIGFLLVIFIFFFLGFGTRYLELCSN